MDLLITHTDLDGISPIILYNLTNEEFEYKSIEINEVDETFDELFNNDYQKYKNIYVTDLSLTEHVYEMIDKLNLNNILVFDHHASHLFANTHKYVNVVIDYDGIQTCGTEIFYKFLLNKYKELNKTNIKEYVDMVRELDTYHFTSELPREIDFIRSVLGRSEFIKSITKRLKKDKEHFELTAFEKRYVKLKHEEQKRYMNKREENMFRYLIDGYKCGIVFAESYKSDLGNYLSNNHPELDLIIIIDAGKSISYRTAKDDIPVNAFAEKYTGGGHQKASGSKFDNNDRINIINSYFDNPKEIIEEEKVE